MHIKQNLTCNTFQLLAIHAQNHEASTQVQPQQVWRHFLLLLFIRVMNVAVTKSSLLLLLLLFFTTITMTLPAILTGAQITALSGHQSFVYGVPNSEVSPACRPLS